jgi:hypothetical protein
MANKLFAKVFKSVLAAFKLPCSLVKSILPVLTFVAAARC